MNHSDSQRFSTVVESVGYQPTEKWQDADLVVFNTCSVKQKAEDRVIGMGPQIAQLKQANPNLKIVLSGCMARRTWQGVSRTGSPIQMATEDRAQQLQDLMPWVDIVLETKDFGKLPQMLGFRDERNASEILLETGGAEHYLSFKPKYKNSFQAYVPISTGCDHFCTYCIVPFSRGNEVCRSAESIIAEVWNLINSGYKDITLLGQTVNRWVNPDFDQEIKQGAIANTKIPSLNTRPFSDVELASWRNLFSKLTFAIDAEWVRNHLRSEDLIVPQDFLQLLQVLDQIPGEWWTTWVSSHPNYMTDELIKFIGKSSQKGFWNKEGGGEGHQRPYLHFALQAGSDQILKRMNRRYTYAEFKEVRDKMVEHIPMISLSTDIIVGFPKETEADFQETAKAMRECSFDMAYISEFSPRKGTAAGLLKDDISWEQKTIWKNYLNDNLLKQTSQEYLQQFVGTEQIVLIDGFDRKANQYTGRLANSKVVHFFAASELPVGSFVKAKISAAKSWSLEASLA